MANRCLSRLFSEKKEVSAGFSTATYIELQAASRLHNNNVKSGSIDDHLRSEREVLSFANQCSKQKRKGKS